MLLVLMFYPLYFIAKSFFILLHFHQVGTREQIKEYKKLLTWLCASAKFPCTSVCILTKQFASGSKRYFCVWCRVHFSASQQTKDRIESLTTKINKVSRTARVVSKSFHSQRSCDSQESGKKSFFYLFSHRLFFIEGIYQN